MTWDRFWFHALRLSVKINKAAWRVYVWSEKLRDALLRVWSYPNKETK